MTGRVEKNESIRSRLEAQAHRLDPQSLLELARMDERAAERELERERIALEKEKLQAEERKVGVKPFGNVKNT